MLRPGWGSISACTEASTAPGVPCVRPAARPGSPRLAECPWYHQPSPSEREELPGGRARPGCLPSPVPSFPPSRCWAHRAGREAPGRWGSRTGCPRCWHLPRWPRSRQVAAEPGSDGNVRVCARVCAPEPSRLGGVQALRAESANLPLINSALCNITYMSLHLTPIILRKAQALFQPVGLRASGADLPGT